MLIFFFQILKCFYNIDVQKFPMLEVYKKKKKSKKTKMEYQRLRVLGFQKRKDDNFPFETSLNEKFLMLEVFGTSLKTFSIRNF